MAPLCTFFLYLGLGCTSCNKKTAADTDLTAGAPITIAAPRAAFVTNNASDSISVFDREGDAVQTIAVDVDPSAHEAPHHLAIDGSAKRVYVALAFPPTPSATRKKDSHASHGGSVDRGKLARLDLETLAVREAVLVEENPGDVVLTHDRKRVLVTHYDMKRVMDVAARGAATPSTSFADLTVIDAATMKKLGSRAVCAAPHGVVTTKDDKTAFVACYGSDELAIVDLAGEGFPTVRIPLGATPGVPGVPRYGPYSATLTPDEKRVVLANLESKDVRFFDRAEKRFADVVTLDAKAFMPAFSPDGALLVPTQAPDGLVRIDGTKIDKRVSFTKAECALPHVVRFDGKGRGYLVCEGDHTGPGAVLEIEPKTLETKKRWTVGAYPDGIGFAEDGTSR